MPRLKSQAFIHIHIGLGLGWICTYGGFYLLLNYLTDESINSYLYKL